MSETVYIGAIPGSGLQAPSAILQGPARAPCKESAKPRHGDGEVRVPHYEIRALFSSAGVKYAIEFGYFDRVSGPVASLQGMPSCDWGFSDLQGFHSGNSGGVAA
jgi:hypothetical protein